MLSLYVIQQFIYNNLYICIILAILAGFRKAHMCAFVYSSCHIYYNKMHAYALYRVYSNHHNKMSAKRKQQKFNIPKKINEWIMMFP